MSHIQQSALGAKPHNEWKICCFPQPSLPVWGCDHNDQTSLCLARPCSTPHPATYNMHAFASATISYSLKALILLAEHKPCLQQLSKCICFHSLLTELLIEKRTGSEGTRHQTLSDPAVFVWEETGFGDAAVPKHTEQSGLTGGLNGTGCYKWPNPQGEHELIVGADHHIQGGSSWIVQHWYPEDDMQGKLSLYVEFSSDTRRSGLTCSFDYNHPFKHHSLVQFQSETTNVSLWGHDWRSHKSPSTSCLLLLPPSHAQLSELPTLRDRTQWIVAVLVQH